MQRDDAAASANGPTMRDEVQSPEPHVRAAARTALLVARCRRWVLVAAAIYVAVMPTNALNFWRSFSMITGGACTVVLLIAGWRGRSERIPSPGWPLLVACAFWGVWSLLSIAWSVHPEYSWAQAKGEVLWSAIVASIVYVAARDADAWRLLVTVVLASFAGIASFAIGLELSTYGWPPGRWHAGPGPWTTYLVLFVPFLLTLLVRPPIGTGAGRFGMAAAIALFALVLVTARIADNRMVWIALATVLGVIGALHARRWRSGALRSPVLRVALLLMVFVTFAALFTDTAREKAEVFYSPDTTIEETLARDPRIELWEHMVERVKARPWLGYGFGRAILSKELRAELGDPLLWHAHNLFGSQWLQSGAIGLAAFVAMFLALAWRYRAFYRSRSDALALVGIIGLALLAGFVVKNLTDDFMFRVNAKQFWVLNALLLGWGARLERAERVNVTRPAADRTS